MGLLKHVICPFYVLLHGISAITGCASLESWANVVGLTMTEEEVNVATNDTRQLHMLGCLRGFNAAIAILALFGTLIESSHYRQVLAVSLIVMDVTMTYDAYTVGIEMWYIPATFTVLTIIALLISFKEPGIFTKDKQAAAGRKKQG